METTTGSAHSGTLEVTAEDTPALVTRAREILEAADRRGIELRALGGVAIYLRAGEAGRRLLGRDYGDIDLVAHRKESRDLRALLEELGYVGQQLFNATHGDRRLLYHNSQPEHRVDIFLDIFEMCHKFDLGPRLAVEPMTLPSADLLVTKLQIAEINAKDLTDCVLLLLDHTPAERDGARWLNVSYIAGACAADWGLYTTLTDNLAKLDQYLPSVAIEAKQRAIVAERVCQVLAAVEAQPKSMRWKARARIGRRVPWHDTPEEVA